MGPRRIRRGKPGDDADVESTSCPSMGPRGIRRGKPHTVRFRRLQPALLQWGHGESAVENCRRRRILRYRRQPFNGATANPPWKTPAFARMPGSWSMTLQWGHGESAVEYWVAMTTSVYAWDAFNG